MEHPPGRSGDQRIGRRFFPVHVLWLRHALVALDLGELGETTVIGFVTPNLERGRVHRIAAVLDPLAITVPLAAVHYHFVAHFDVGHVLADRVDDAGRVAAADVEVFRLAALVTGSDDIDRKAEARPDVVVVDSRRHHVHQHFVVGDGRGIHHFLLKRLRRLAETVRADQPGVHFLRNFAQGRPIT